MHVYIHNTYNIYVLYLLHAYKNKLYKAPAWCVMYLLGVIEFKLFMIYIDV